MNQPIAMNTARKHVVWLDVVRLVAMFTVSTQFRASPFERALFSALNRVLLIN